MSDSVRPHRWQPTRLPRPWDSPGKNTEVRYHFLLQCMKVKSERKAAQSRPTLRDPMDCSLPDSLEEGMTTQFSILDWRVPWTEEPGGQQSTGSERVRQDWSNSAHMDVPRILYLLYFSWHFSFSRFWLQWTMLLWIF